MKKDTLKLHFMLNSTNENVNGEFEILLKLKQKKESALIPTGIWLNSAEWDADTGQAKGTVFKKQTVNNTLNDIRSRVNAIINFLEDNCISPTVTEIERKLNEKEQQFTLLKLFDYHLEHRNNTGKHGITVYTSKIYGIVKEKLKKFLRYEYNLNDAPLDELDVDFLYRFKDYLSKNCSNKTNTTDGNIRKLRAVIHTGIRIGWISKDPFTDFKHETFNPEKVPLTLKELRKIERFDISYEPRLELTKDLFLFMCYTGISYGDLKILQPENISFTSTGKNMLYFKRVKNDIPCETPLPDKARSIILKYKDFNPKSFKGRGCYLKLGENWLLPTPSNQKLNNDLHVLEKMIKIPKNLTCHIARYTFSTLSHIDGQVPLRTIQGVLGHAKIETTIYYTKENVLPVFKAVDSVNVLFNEC